MCKYVCFFSPSWWWCDWVASSLFLFFYVWLKFVRFHGSLRYGFDQVWNIFWYTSFKYIFCPLPFTKTSTTRVLLSQESWRFPPVFSSLYFFKSVFYFDYFLLLGLQVHQTFHLGWSNILLISYRETSGYKFYFMFLLVSLSIILIILTI
jgi:hypothetical protein